FFGTFSRFGLALVEACLRIDMGHPHFACCDHRSYGVDPAAAPPGRFNLASDRGCQLLVASNLPPAASQSAFVPSVKPLPLQAFWPLQAFVAVLQALWPLQALAPMQWPFASSAANCSGLLTAEPAIKRAAAAAAIAAPEVMSIFMVVLQL